MHLWHIVYADPEMDRELRLDGKPLATIEAYSRAEAMRYYSADCHDKMRTAGYGVTAIPAIS